MTLRKKKTPRASQHCMGWRARQKYLLLPVAGEFFLLTLPFIERAAMKIAGARVENKRLAPSLATFMLGGAPKAHEVLPEK